MSDLSRVEQLLRNALGEDIYEVTPQSRVEILLAQLNELIEGLDTSVDPEAIASIVTGWLAENIHDGAVVDSSLSVSGAAAESKKVGDELSDLKEDLTLLEGELVPVINDYYGFENVDISEEIQNGFWENGTYYANGSYRSIKHNCVAGVHYKISTYLRAVNNWAVVYFYDSNNVLLAKYGGSADGTLTTDTYYQNYEAVAPANSAYMLVSSYNVSNKPIRLMVRENISSAKYRDVSYRYLEHLTIENGYYDNGTFYANNNYRTAKVACEIGEKYKVDAYYYGPAKQPVAQFYDANMIFIGRTDRIETTGQLNDVIVTIPDGCSFVVFVNYVIADHIDFNIRKYISGGYPLFQKNYIAIGDSITYIRDGWRPWFNKVTGATEVLCTAVSGAHLCDYSDTVVDGNPEATEHSNTISNQVQSILNNPPTTPIDFIIISAGTNDSADGTELNGPVTQFVSGYDYIDIDTVDRTRYDGAMRWAAEKLWSQFPDAVIFWATPIQGNEHLRQTWVQLLKCDYMKKVASYLACPVIDATRNSGIYGRYENNGSEGKYLYDGLHPNMYGRKKMGLYYASVVTDYYTHEID